MSKSVVDIDINKIMGYLPHRYPFLLLDRVVEVVEGESLKAIKNVTVNEPFFQGHFPVRPIMPGVLILEAMAQATGVLGAHTMQLDELGDTIYLLVSIDKARFKKPAEPGDQLLIEVQKLRVVKNMWKFQTKATIDGQLACSAEIMCAHTKAKF
ncbi:MAG TPA: 3-hydroxyacyl-[acyl-carrier-protein] dehydratase FabZ [Gammaproteobacteria bacterium]|nr:3-hydroxyacyl-[acyl-carrier-protein] dehydratase FabZ [Gammaproteobacteria bacterium]